MKRGNIIIVLLLIPALVFLGYGLTSELSRSCRTLSTGECRLLWGTAILSIIGGAWLVVLLRKRQATRLYEAQNSDGEANLNLGAWQRATLRIVLSSLLTSAPLLVRGSFIAVVFGAGMGMMLVGLVGRLTGRITDAENT